MFSDTYIQRVMATKSHLCVGLDPILEKMPTVILAKAESKYGKTPQGAGYAIFEFNKLVIDCLVDQVPIIKPQLAYYEKYDQYGLAAFWQTVAYAKEHGLLVIADAKRGDIGTTSQAYAEAFYKTGADDWTSTLAVDAMTVNPYLGSDGLDPFITNHEEKGTIILVKTSNPSSGEFQDQLVAERGKSISDLVCDYIKAKSERVGKYGFSNIGAVIGATYPQDLARYRKLLPHSLFLVPGIGYQGGDVNLIAAAFNDEGFGAMISSTRAINYAYEDVSLSEKAVKACITDTVATYNHLITTSLIKANKFFL